jgi:hypothetical protein
MRVLKIVLLVFLGAFVVIQFFRPEKNDTPPGASDLFAVYPAAPEVRRLVETSCYDCHSNQTRYPWYAQVQPVRWWLESHIADGKRALNFSEFADYSKRTQMKKLQSVSDDVQDKFMPLESYTWAHREARLAEVQIQLLSEWAEELADTIDPK